MAHEPPYIRVARSIKEEWILKPSALPGSRLPTERQLREHFGVSRATIGRALDLLAREGLVETRQGSGAYVRELQSSGQTKLVAFITPHLPSGRGDSLPVRTLSGVERRAVQLGWQVVTATSNFSVAHEEVLIERFMRLGVEGIILQPVNYPEPRRLSELATDHLARRWHKLPIVLTGLGFEEWRRPLVRFDNYRLGYDMTAALIEHGHRRILFMHTSLDRLHTSIHDRCKGWREAMSHAGLAIPEAYDGWPVAVRDYVHWLEQPDAGRLVQSALSLEPRPDAIVAWEDSIAMQLMEALASAGVDVPGDIRVTGFDNHAVGRYFVPPFPTSLPDFPRLGEVAMETLNTIVTERSSTPRTYILPVPIVWRSHGGRDAMP